MLEQVREAKALGRPLIFTSMGTVITGDSEDFGWKVKPQQPDGRRGVTGKQLCQAAWKALFEVFGAERHGHVLLRFKAFGCRSWPFE